VIRPSHLAHLAIIAVFGCKPAAIADANPIASSQPDATPSSAASSVPVEDASANEDSGAVSRIPLPQLGPVAAGGARCLLDAGTAKGRFVPVCPRPASRADKVGADGGLDPDGHGDVVIDVQFDGAVLAFHMTSDTESIVAGTPWGAMHVQGSEKLHVQKHVATLIAFDGDKALNDRTRPLELGDGLHRLTLRVSGHHPTPKTTWRIWAIRADCTLVEGPSIR